MVINTTPKLVWTRAHPGSRNNFDLILKNPEVLDLQRCTELLNRLEAERHRGLKLKRRARKALRRWLDDPSQPLKSESYALLSNWFLTGSGDRTSLVAAYCEQLWDCLFPARPPRRLTSPEPGRNHVVLASEFEAFFSRLQAESEKESMPPLELPARPGASLDDIIEEVPIPEDAGAGTSGAREGAITATFRTRKGTVTLEGPAREIAEFFRLLDL